jgi:hypothetical protein
MAAPTAELGDLPSPTNALQRSFSLIQNVLRTSGLPQGIVCRSAGT